VNAASVKMLDCGGALGLQQIGLAPMFQMKITCNFKVVFISDNWLCQKAIHLEGD
jgi:hypothetical protein